MDYEELLDKAQKELPENVTNNERFEIPKVRGHIQGNKTIISNFNQIATTLRRPVQHLLKYVLRELGTPGELKPTGLIFGSKINASKINEKISAYAKQYVICVKCGKPDTSLEKESNIVYMKCTACGAKIPTKK